LPLLKQESSELLEAIQQANEHSWHFGADPTAGNEEGEI
jgi:hypothetical protein